MRVVHGGQLDPGFIIDFTLTDIRTVQHVILIIEPHQSVLLLPYLIFLKTTLTLVPFHVLPNIGSVSTAHFILIKISVALVVVCAVEAFTHGVVLRHIPPLLMCTTFKPKSASILLSLSAIFGIGGLCLLEMTPHLRRLVNFLISSELYVILFEFFLDKGVGITTQLRKLNFFLFDNEWW